MTRVKRAVNARKRKKTIFKATKGYRSKNSKVFKLAKQAWMKAGIHAYTGRKLKKRQFRTLWISRISAAIKQIDPSKNYSTFISALEKNNIGLNRKILADLALNHPEAFAEVVKTVG